MKSVRQVDHHRVAPMVPMRATLSRARDRFTHTHTVHATVTPTHDMRPNSHTVRHTRVLCSHANVFMCWAHLLFVGMGVSVSLNHPHIQFRVVACRRTTLRWPYLCFGGRPNIHELQHWCSMCDTHHMCWFACGCRSHMRLHQGVGVSWGRT